MKINIKIENLTFSYSKQKVFENFNMNIIDHNVSIIGTPASGKTTLARLLSGLYLNNSITIMDKKMSKSTISMIRREMSVVLNDFSFVAETVLNELSFGMENICFSEEKIKKEIEKIGSLFEIDSLFEEDPSLLSNENKALTKILSFLLMKPKIIVIDDLISYLSESIKNKLFYYMKDNKIKFINITSNIDELLYSDYVFVLDRGVIALEGKKESVLNEEIILKRLGFNLPFIIDLSKQLISYDLINHIYYSDDELVNEIWK